MGVLWLVAAAIATLLPGAADASDFVLVRPGDVHAEAKYLGAGQGFARWAQPTIRWYYNPAHASAPFTDVVETVALIEDVMAEWEGVSGIRFQFQGLTTRAPTDWDDGVTVVGWNQSGHGSFGGGVADAPWEVYISLGYWPMFEGFVAIDPSFCPPTWPAVEREFVFRHLMVHELGHLLCLGHSDNPNSVMYAGPYNGVQPVRPDDIAGVQALYGLPRELRLPSPLEIPPVDPGVTVNGSYFAVGTNWDDLTIVTEIDDATPDQLLFVWWSATNLPFGEMRHYLVDPYGFPQRLIVGENQWMSVASGTSLQDIAIVKTLPGTWQFVLTIENATIVTFPIPVNTTVEWNQAPTGSLILTPWSGLAPHTATIAMTASDPEGGPVMAVWHVPGQEEWSQPAVGTTSHTVTVAEPGVYDVFIELSDDWERYPLAGEGFRKLLHAQIWAYETAPDPRRPDGRLP
jgi:hypothetical protein